jgi:hypothetical protein
VLALTAALGVIVGSIAFVPNLPVAAVLALGIGGAAGFLGVVNISWLQERSERHLTGRVMSLAIFSPPEGCCSSLRCSGRRARRSGRLADRDVPRSGFREPRSPRTSVNKG